MTVAKNSETKRRLRNAFARLIRDERGNTFFLVAAATLPMIGIIGSGVDIGRAYMADLRLQQACDAGALAGRRAMVGTTYTSANQAEATKMFNINYDTGTYGSTNIAFNSVQDGPSNVKGTASAKLPTSLMKVFGQNEFNLSVECTAKLEVSNVDVMLVLDVTGSMATVNSGDTVTRLQALKTATMNFFDTLTGAAVGDGRMRFGVVPYNFNVNVGGVLTAANLDWLDDEVTLPSRTPVYTTTWGSGTTTYGTPFDGPVTPGTSWANDGSVVAADEEECEEDLTPPANSVPVSTGVQPPTQTGQYVDADGNLVTTYNNNENFRFNTYRHNWVKPKNKWICRVERRTDTFTRTTPSTVTQPPVQVFSTYRYEDRPFDVTAARSGGTVTYDVGDNGVGETVGWNGCIIERQTTPFTHTEAAPADAFDMDIDMVPTTADPDTQWKLQMGYLAFGRSTRAPLVSSTDRSAFNNNSCPVAATKLTTMTSADRANFETYINSFTANGNTYHDGGMTWGARLISPDGLFAAENQTAPNGRTIQRHLIFMTDGEMVTNIGNLSFQGYEFTMQRVGQSDNTNGNQRHTNRFLQVCAAAKAKGITIWTIDFDATQTASLVTCASGSDKAFTAANAATLNTQFQAIARQISKLRIAQ
jgi:Flp pilus assembly protein TadG